MSSKIIVLFGTIAVLAEQETSIHKAAKLLIKVNIIVKLSQLA